ncbi:Vacuolar protein sorting 35 (Vps35) [Blattamonas nauphoetae]|uniref:Vacuolar protein sorting-associated protein 35 n=1 Tax=Blattamonas nauphoetae TaxID=2049346 RepID=A0ABQ9XM03_9EUKA|nr:Vacuolar protein sorting 35 (Vps35) [Blattamonas nauphoetae]
MAGRGYGAAQEESVFSQNEKEWLQQQKDSINENHRMMLSAMDHGNLNGAFKYAAYVADEMKTASLTPKAYYSLYIYVFDKLRDLDTYVSEQNKKGMPMQEIYERVQHAPNVLSRLYLLICVGSVYIKSNEAPTKRILKDLVEMCKGVQHPMRGLFLRYYLAQMTRDKLPDGNSTKVENGTLADSVDFVLTNFVEMNKLWVRMQYQGTTRDKTLRERERNDVRTLVGANLVNMANLDGIDERTYQTTILPGILDQVLSCHDATAQHYLMDVVINIFPCEFHLTSLDRYLAGFAKMDNAVDIEQLILNLINRLTQFCEANPSKIAVSSENESTSLFTVLSNSIADVLKTRKSTIKTKGKLGLYEALMSLVLSVYPGNVSYVDTVFEKVLTSLGELGEKSIVVDSEVKLVMGLVMNPMNKAISEYQRRAIANQATDTTPFLTTRDFLTMSNLSSMLSLLDKKHRHEAAIQMMEAFNKAPPSIDTPELLEAIFKLEAPLVFSEEEDEEAEDADFDEESFAAEQNSVSRISHMLQNDHTDSMYRLLFLARKNFGKGGLKRVRYSMTPLFFVALKLAEKIHSIESGKMESASQMESTSTTTDSSDMSGGLIISSQKVFQFLLEIIRVVGQPLPELGIKLCTQAMLCADRCKDQTNAYEYMTQACTLYEDSLSDSKSQFNALRSFIATLQRTSCIEPESYDILIKNTTQYSSKLIKRPDQARAVSLCAHMFWSDRDGVNSLHDSTRVIECLKRAGDLADKIPPQAMQATIFAEILNEHLFFIAKGIDKSPTGYIIAIITLIQQRLPTLDQDTLGPMEAYFNNTLAHINFHKKLGANPAYQEITLPH